MPRHCLAVPLFYFVASCGQAPPPPPILRTANSAAPSSTALIAPLTSANAPINPPPDPPPTLATINKISIPLKPGDSPCTLRFEGKLFNEGPEWFSLTSITNMKTEESGGCKAGELYDFETQKKAPNPDDLPPGPLDAGTFRKPGQTLPDDVGEGSQSNLIEDLNFDEYADICVVLMTGAYNYLQFCWLFDPTSRTFIRHPELDPVIFVEIDRSKKKLKSVYRTGGSGLEIDEFVWQKGKLVQTYEAKTYFQERPDGTPLTPPDEYWMIRRELRQGKLVKTYEGPIRSKP